MSLPGRFRAAAFLGLALITLACAGRRAAETGITADRALMGVYKVRIEDPGHKTRRFRLLLFAELPDRVHAEVLSPLGNIVTTIDGGDGRLAVTFVREGVAFVGPARPEALERVLGVRVSLEALVRGLLTGSIDSGRYAVEREAAADTGLPDRLRIADPPRSLLLELRKLQPLGARRQALGTGQAPAGVELRPLSELDLYRPADGVSEPGNVR